MSFMNLTLRFSPAWFYCFHEAFSVEASDFQTRLSPELRFKSLSNRFARGPAEVVQLAPSKDSQRWPTALNGFSKSWHSFSDICAAEPHVHLPTAERLPCSPAVLNLDAADRLQICQDAKLLAFWMRLPDFFLYKEKQKVVLHPKKQQRIRKV